MLDGIPLAQLEFPPYFADLETRVVALPPGDHTLTAILPSRSGLDSLTLNYRESNAAALTGLAGLPTGEVASPETTNQLIALLAGLAPAR